MRTIVTYETQHGSAKKIAETIANALNCRCINVDTPYEAENPANYDSLVLVFNFRGPYTAQLTKLFLSKMQGKLDNKHIILIGEGIFSEKEFPVVADQIKSSITCASFNKYFIKGQLRVATLTSEEQYLLADFSRLTGMTITDMGELKLEEAQELANNIKELLNTLPILEDKQEKKWICTVCGYIHTGDNPPDSCPVCKQPKEKFKEM